MKGQSAVAMGIALVLCTGSISGCFSRDSGELDAGDLAVGNDMVASGSFHTLDLSATSRLSVYVPYLVLDPTSGYVQNSTVVDIEKGDALSLDVLIPPRTEGIYLLIAEFGRSQRALGVMVIMVREDPRPQPRRFWSNQGPTQWFDV